MRNPSPAPERPGAGATPDPRPNLTAPRHPSRCDFAPLKRHSPDHDVLAPNYKRRASGGPSGLNGLSLRAGTMHILFFELHWKRRTGRNLQ
jgi:hypothetical protein